MSIRPRHRINSSAKKLQFTGIARQGGRVHLWTPHSVPPFDLQVDKLDLPAVVQRGADEAENLLVDAQAGVVSVDGPGHGHQHQAVGGRQGPEAEGLQVGAEEETLVLGQRQETKTNQISAQELLHLLTFGTEEKKGGL